MSHTIDLNIFTNCTKKNSWDANLLGRTYRSFVDIFGLDSVNDVRVFVDPSPRTENLDTYIECIKNEIDPCQIHKTNGLADGYVKSTEICTTDYIFQLEHDWEFLDSIKHTIPELIQCMSVADMHHLRFNKAENISRPIRGLKGETLTEIKVDGIWFCQTTKRSNNPHIINRLSYLSKWNDRIQRYKRRWHGIENRFRKTRGHIYGRLNYEPQIRHLNGRGNQVLPGPEVVVGRWHPGQMSELPATLEWDASQFVKRSGDYEFAFMYAKGRHGINTIWVELLEDGKPTGRDGLVRRGSCSTRTGRLSPSST
jgi:hypothetical protein